MNKISSELAGYKLEACVETIQQALNAERNGASRIELCADLQVGGTTPSYGLIQLAKELLSIPVFVIIRPRGGDFFYDNYEIEIMKRDICACISLNVDGLVFGLLDQNKQVNLDKMRELINYTKTLNSKFENFTFHMAFDEIEGNLQNKLDSINNLIGIGVNRILTKGCITKAPDGVDNLKFYINYVKGFDKKLVIMPGGGVTNLNCKQIAEDTGAVELHGTKIVENKLQSINTK